MLTCCCCCRVGILPLPRRGRCPASSPNAASQSKLGVSDASALSKGVSVSKGRERLLEEPDSKHL